MIPTTGSVYAAIAMFVWFSLPLFCLADPNQNNGTTEAIIAGILVVGLFAIAYWRCSSPVLSYWNGLSIVGGAWRTGIIQLTAMIATPIILLSHLIAIVLGLMSFFFGQAWSQRAYLRLCHAFCRGKFDLQQAIRALPQA